MLIILKFLLIILALPFVAIGYSIFFNKHYNLALKVFPKLDDTLKVTFAKRMGLIQFVGGLILWVCGIVCLWLNKIASIVIISVSVVAFVVALLVHIIYFNQLNKKLKKSLSNN